MNRHVRSATRRWLAAGSVLAVGACADAPTGLSRTPPPPSLAVAPGPYAPGASYFGENDHIEYIAGNLPLIFTAPHGGQLEPAGIPLRTDASCGVDVTTVRDANTELLVRDIQQAFLQRTGGYPHIVINHLHRNRLDANRPIEEAACGDPQAEEAWRDYHAFVEAARARILTDHGKGWYTDVHGHGHDIQRLELGYELSGTTLRRSDAELDGSATFENASSIRTFSQESPLSFSALLRGPTALGTLFTAAGYPAVPSQQDPAPDVGEDYFSGGYNTDRYACSRGGQICGVQIEANFTGVRNNATTRSEFAVALAAVYGEYLQNFGIALPAPPPPPAGAELVVDNLNAYNDPLRARFAASTNWTSGTNSQSWGPNFQLSSASASATNDGAEFFFRVAVPGTYIVEAWWPAQSGRSPGASYRVFELDGGLRLADLKVSQRVNGGRWNVLGTYDFTQVGWAKVLMSRSLSEPGSLAADAIRITAANEAPVVSIDGGATILQGERYASGGSFADPDPNQWSATVDYGDGSGSAALSLSDKRFALDHRYTVAGTFTVTVAVADGFATGSSTAQVVVQTPAQGVAALAASVSALVDGGALSTGLGRSLTAKLDAATARLASGSPATAVAQLKAFTNQVASLHAEGVLGAADAEALRQLAGRIVRSIEGT